jgi:hypothetical protein
VGRSPHGPRDGGAGHRILSEVRLGRSRHGSRDDGTRHGTVPRVSPWLVSRLRLGRSRHDALPA